MPHSDAGTYAPSASSDSCSACSSFEYSREGATSCDLAVEGYYFPPNSDSSVTICPTTSYCRGGDNLPKPFSGYWVDRSSSRYSQRVLRCARDTCKGGAEHEIVNGTSCWSVLYFNKTWLNQVTGGYPNSVCDTDELQCRPGTEHISSFSPDIFARTKQKKQKQKQTF
jgi:hypothetical protein